jgi:hypothetical protein
MCVASDPTPTTGDRSVTEPPLTRIATSVGVFPVPCTPTASPELLMEYKKLSLFKGSEKFRFPPTQIAPTA